MLTLLAIFGDDATRANIQKNSEADTAVGLANKIAYLNGSWIRSNKDEAAQGKVLDEVQKLAKAKPASMEVAQQVAMLTQLGAASPANQKRAEDIVSNDLTSPIAKQMKEEIASRRKLQEMENKPIDINGTKVDGSALERGLERQSHPRRLLGDVVRPVQGGASAREGRLFEISRQGTGSARRFVRQRQGCASGFVKDDPAMAWPQLFDAKQNPELNWHPLAKSYGINGIPTMFLIDKKGVLRRVKARENFEELIPKLLAE